MSYYLAILDRNDNPIFQLEFGSSRHGGDGNAKFDTEISEISPFIVHAALDVVDEMQKTTQSLYLKTVDRYDNLLVSAFVTAGGVRMMLLHDSKNEEAIRLVFNDLYDLYVKTLLNPFYKTDTPITSKAFDTRVRSVCAKYL